MTKKSIPVDFDPCTAMEASLREDELLFSARAALDAWGSLPATLRQERDPAAEALFSAAFGLASAPSARDALLLHGAWSSIDDDEAVSLARFLSLGARLEPAKPVEADHSAYSKSWSHSALHFCADKRRWRCAELLAGDPLGISDALACEPLFKEPEPSPLREIGAGKLIEIELARARRNGLDEKKSREAVELGASAREFIVVLLNSQSEHGENLGRSIAVSELRCGNPFFLALSRISEDESFGARRPGPEAAKAISALAASGLWNPASPMHREALLSLCNPKSASACAFAAEQGLGPCSGSAAMEHEILERCADLADLRKAPAFSLFLGDYAREPGFALKAFEQARRTVLSTQAALAKKDLDANARTSSEWEAKNSLSALCALVNASSDPATGFALASREPLSKLSAEIDAFLVGLDSTQKRTPSVAKLAELGQSLGRSLLPKCFPPRI